jgi:dipeptidyl aminopeptidase/acylaminoacyl peptidase
MRNCFTKFFAAALLGVAMLPLAAQSSASAHVEELLQSLNRGQLISHVAISPDGKRLAWMLGGHNGSEIHVAAVGDLSKSQHITAAANAESHCHEGQIFWSPDSSALAFASDCGDSGGQMDLYLTHFEGSAPRRLTHLHGELDQPAFSPDGRSIAFLYVEGATRPAGALAAMNAPSGVIGEDGIEVQRLAVVPATAQNNAAPTLLSPATLHLYEFSWAPDSKSVAYIAANPPGENNWWVAKLYTQQIGCEPLAILDPASVSGPLHGMQMALPRWSPNGKWIALIGGLMSDQGATGGDVWAVSATGGLPFNLTPGRAATPEWVTWASPDHLWVTELAAGKSRLASFKLSPGVEGNSLRVTEDRVPFVLPGSVGADDAELSLSPTADHARFVFRASSYGHASEVYMVEPTAQGEVHLTQLSHLNDGIQPSWGNSESLEWTNEGFHVQGWLILPKDYDPAKKYPMIVEVHGGPAWAESSHWGGSGGLSPAAFSALGYFVLLPNPRGSFGQGEAFVQANRKDFGHGDLRDILAGVDAVLAKYPVDAKRVGLAGWSYGGFMSMFAVTQTDRFRASVAGAGISDWQSYYGENSIDQWMLPYFGASVYDDPEVYAKSSAISYIKQARTPTLIIVGDRDGECPAPQSFELWHALRAQGVPTQLVVYPNEGHGFTDPTHRRDVLVRAIDWFARQMPPTL